MLTGLALYSHLQVAESTVAGAGRGLFVRKKLPGAAVRLDRGAIFCGYASGTTSTDPNQSGGKSVGFRLTSASQLVVFDGEVMPLREVGRCL